MKKNMEIIDKAIITIVAIGIAVLSFASLIAATVAAFLLIFSEGYNLTSFTNICPKYLPSGITKKRI